MQRFLNTFCLKTNLFVVLALFANFKAKRGRNGSKDLKTYLVNVS